MKKIGAAAGIAIVLLGASWLLFHRQIKKWLRPAKVVSSGLFQDPEGLAIDPEGNIYVSDEDRGQITVLSPDGKVLGVYKEPFIHGDSLIAHSRQHVVTIGEHELYVLDLSGEKARILKQIGRRGHGPGEFEDPEGIAEDPATGDLYVTDEDHRRIQVFSREGEFKRAFPVPRDPEGIGFGHGVLVVTYSKDGECEVYQTSGKRNGAVIIGKPELGEFRNPDCARVGPDGMLYITDQKNNRIIVGHFDKGSFCPERAIGRPGSGPAEFNDPEDLAFDPQGRLLVADGGNHRIQILKPTGEFIAEIR